MSSSTKQLERYTRQKHAKASFGIDREWMQSFQLQNTISGATGGIHVVDARTMAVGSFRLQLSGEFFYKGDFLNPGDHHRHAGGGLSLSAGLTPFLEAYAGLSGGANRNRSEAPNVIQSLGDVTVGLKVGKSVTNWLTIGADARAMLLNSIGDLGISWKSTSAALRLSTSADFRNLRKSKPLIARLSLEYLLDNSSALIKKVEQDRYNALPDPATSYSDEDRNLVSRVERYGLGVHRVDQIRIGVGVEIPIKVSRTVAIHPLLEWNLGIPVNRQSYDCLFVPSADNPNVPPYQRDGCLNKQGFKAFPQVITIGARFLPPLRGMSIHAGLDIGLTGVSTTVRELSPNAPYMVRFGAAYAYDTRSQQAEKENVPVVAAQQSPKREGKIKGNVVDLQTQQVVPHVVIRFINSNKTSLYSDDLGNFTTYDFAPGNIQLELMHPRYEPSKCEATIPKQGGDVQITCRMKALPSAGKVEGKVSDSTGAEIGPVDITMDGPRAYRGTVDREGKFAIADVPPGAYSLKFESEKYYPQTLSLQVEAQKTATANIALNPRPKVTSVVVGENEIILKKRIHFANDSAEIVTDSQPLINEIVEVLQQHKNIRRVEIQGHTDNRGAAARNKKLSQERAESVRNALIQSGVEPTRISAKGYGSDKPLAPNITSRNRAKNRRVQIVITEKE